MTEESDAVMDAGADVLRIDDRRKVVFVNGHLLHLSHKEFDLLSLLAGDCGRVFSNGEILEALWPGHERASASDVRQSIYLLRRRIEIDPRKPRLVETVPGFGYRLAAALAD